MKKLSLALLAALIGTAAAPAFAADAVYQNNPVVESDTDAGDRLDMNGIERPDDND